MARMSASASGVRSSNRRSSQLTGNSRASVSSTLSLSVNYENDEDLSPAECFKRGTCRGRGCGRSYTISHI